MEKIYLVIGTVVFWLLIVLLALIVIYGLIVISNTFRLAVKAQNWFNYYIQRTTIDSEILRKHYRMFLVVNKRDNKRYILLYRLRNIKTYTNK